MNRLPTGGLALVLLLCPCVTAQANAISYRGQGFHGLGLNPTTVPIDLPDLTEGGTIILGPGIPTVEGPGTPEGWSTKFSVGPGFWFALSYEIPGSTPSNDLPTLHISGSMTGMMVVGPNPDQYGGSYTGVATQIDLYNPYGKTGIPQPMLDLIDHPERIHISGKAGGGRGSAFETRLTIDPAPVPEPTTFAVFLVATGAWIVRGRMKMNRNSG